MKTEQDKAQWEEFFEQYGSYTVRLHFYEDRHALTLNKLYEHIVKRLIHESSELKCQSDKSE